MKAMRAVLPELTTRWLLLLCRQLSLYLLLLLLLTLPTTTKSRPIGSYDALSSQYNYLNGLQQANSGQNYAEIGPTQSQLQQQGLGQNIGSYRGRGYSQHPGHIGSHGASNDVTSLYGTTSQGYNYQSNPSSFDHGGTQSLSPHQSDNTRLQYSQYSNSRSNQSPNYPSQHDTYESQVFGRSQGNSGFGAMKDFGSSFSAADNAEFGYPNSALSTSQFGGGSNKADDPGTSSFGNSYASGFNKNTYRSTGGYNTPPAYNTQQNGAAQNQNSAAYGSNYLKRSTLNSYNTPSYGNTLSNARSAYSNSGSLPGYSGGTGFAHQNRQLHGSQRGNIGRSFGQSGYGSQTGHRAATGGYGAAAYGQSRASPQPYPRQYGNSPYMYQQHQQASQRLQQPQHMLQSGIGDSYYQRTDPNSLVQQAIGGESSMIYLGQYDQSRGGHTPDQVDEYLFGNNLVF